MPSVRIRSPKPGKKLWYSFRSWTKWSLSCMFLASSILALRWYTQALRSIPDTSVTHWRDLNLVDIGQWCLQPNITSCQCANPLTPTHRHGHKTWTEAHLENVKLTKAFQKKTKGSLPRILDVVFIGDSITEGWRGTSFGKPIVTKQENIEIFGKFFDTDRGGQLDGLVLGIAGDKSPNLLWRIQNGEMPKTLKSKIFWLLIGTNDFLKEDQDQCSEEVVLMGIQRVVEEMMILKPDAMIVVNGLLPRSDIGRQIDGRLYKKGEKTVMDAIDIVNSHLKEYCEENNNLEYFDASNIFVRKDLKLGKGKYAKYIPFRLMEDSLHPTPLGYRKWAKKIKEKVKSLTDVKLAQA